MLWRAMVVNVMSANEEDMHRLPNPHFEPTGLPSVGLRFKQKP
jgi:hypothetical protein